MRYLSILLAVLFVGCIMTMPMTAHAKHGCGDTGHGSDPSGGHGNGHGGGDSDGGNGGDTGNGGTSGGSAGISGGASDGAGDSMGFEVTVRCTVVEWWSNGFECPEPMPSIPAE